MSLYNKSGGKIPEITVEQRLKILLENAIGIYAEAHSDHCNSSSGFLKFLYGEPGADGEEMKELGIDLPDISDDTAMLRTMAAVAIPNLKRD